MGGVVGWIDRSLRSGLRGIGDFKEQIRILDLADGALDSLCLDDVFRFTDTCGIDEA